MGNGVCVQIKKSWNTEPVKIFSGKKQRETQNPTLFLQRIKGKKKTLSAFHEQFLAQFRGRTCKTRSACGPT